MIASTRPWASHPDRRRQGLPALRRMPTSSPGFVIPIDAEHMARVLQAKEELERTRERIDPCRFELLYAPSLRILTGSYIPAHFPHRGTWRPNAGCRRYRPFRRWSERCKRRQHPICCRGKASASHIRARSVWSDQVSASRRSSPWRQPQRLLARLGIRPCRRQPVQRSAMDGLARGGTSCSCGAEAGPASWPPQCP